uniref:Uncharacterized protein n=1 Tax=Tanacetum cinerariifolium TaxID=118510 RepID=A0A6L2MS27_TANCI|nr:hypothetical protein [Tanacetum cinerariifolium]
MVVMIVMENIAVVMVVVENMTVEYFLDSPNFGSRLVVGLDDTQVGVDKLACLSFAFQTEDTVARKNLSFVNLGLLVLSFAKETKQKRSKGELSAVLRQRVVLVAGSESQYVKDNAEPVVRNNASSVSNDASMIIINEMPKLTP